VTGVPTVHAASSIPVPSNFSFTLLLTDKDGCELGERGFIYTSDQPMECGRPPTVGTAYNVTSGRFIGSNPGWRIRGFGNKYCQDKPVFEVGLDDFAACKNLSTWSFGFSIMPLWNAA